MGRQMVRISPLRLWLQSTSLLAVLAGYSLLLLANQSLTGEQRQTSHQRLMQQVAQAAQSRAQSRPELERLLSEVLSPGLKLALLPAGATASKAGRAALIQTHGGEWMVGQAPLALADGSTAVLVVEQEVSAAVRQERLAFWLLVVATGIASLFTSGLLRLVLHRGLVQPLEDFTTQLQATQAPPGPEDSIDVIAQPEELQPIARAFNGLQERMRISWERERTFVDGVAHELRTPITLICGHTERLLRQTHPTDGRDSLKLIHKEATRMGSLVKDLLDLARSDSGRLRLQLQPVVGEDALLELYERMATQANGRLQLGHSRDPEQAALIGWADPDRLQQCLTTLVDNALQYSPPSQPITLACSSGPAGELVLHVRDQGPGVADDEREAIFHRFVRGRAGIHAESRGSGIGLAVVKLLMEAMGGQACVSAAPGGGADFQLRLSTAPQQGAVRQ